MKYLFLFTMMLMGCAHTNNNVKNPYKVTITRIGMGNLKIEVDALDDRLTYNDTADEVIYQATKACGKYEVLAGDVFMSQLTYRQVISNMPQWITIHCMGE